jgi:hypothetical protein
LRQWCDPATGKLIEYTIKQGKLISKRVGPEATGYEFGLYAFSELPPDQAQFIEAKFFDYADRKAADALQLHLNGRTTEWTSELRSAWSRFVIALQLRHPDVMPELRISAEAIWSGSNTPILQQRYETIREPDDPNTFDEYLARQDPLTSVKARVNLIVALFDNEIVGEHINKMCWAVIDVSASRHKLLTSDRPVEMFSIKDPKGVIGLPISPTKLFVAVNDRRMFHNFRTGKEREIVRLVNTRNVTRARRFVWATDQLQKVFIKKHMSSRIEATPFFPNLGSASVSELQSRGALSTETVRSPRSSE